MIERAGRAIHKAMDAPMPRFVQQRWEDLTELARRAMMIRAIAAIGALRYEDGWDEDLAIAVGKRLGHDPVMVIECFDGMIAAVLAVDPSRSPSSRNPCPAEAAAARPGDRRQRSGRA
jgi:hypothetical protein